MPDIIHSVPISASADTIVPLISTAKGFAQWWAADSIAKDGAVELGFFKRDTVYRLRPLALEAMRVEWACETGKEWAGSRILFKLEPADKGTLVRFTHADWQAATDYFISCNTVWGELMYRLKAAAEGKGRGPLFLEDSLAY